MSPTVPCRSDESCLEGKVGSLALLVPGILEATLCKGPLLGGAETT